MPQLTWRDGLIYGVRIGLTYMGYVVLAAGRLAAAVAELVAVRGRRLYSIARLSIYESNRRMWAPWVVITVFLLVLAFTHWFLQPPRAAEMGRLYVGTLSLLCSVLLTVMVTILTPLSLPTDIQQQTIYTVVSKPVRRLELIWGRMIGYMALVTVLVARLRRDQPGLPVADRRTHDRGDRAAGDQGQERESHADFKLLLEQADQLRTRMPARVPIKGSLSFLDSRGTPHAIGIDVGQEQSMTRAAQPHRGGDAVGGHLELRHRARSVHAAGPAPRSLNRRIPVDDFLLPGTIEWQLDRVYELDGADRGRPASQGAAQRAGGQRQPRSTRPSPATRRSWTGPAPSTTA